MCMFPRPVPNSKQALRKQGFSAFDCGYCPECLSKKARLWALRCSAQAQVQKGVMVTLTYDEYIHDKRGQVIGERVSDLKVNKSDCQKFIKRLRKHFVGDKVRYLISSEYGARTGRAHYHAILFGVVFDDLIPYKKSKRGNLIYKSKTLEKIWKHGICTVDSININAQIARYCTKYCMKDKGAEDTFMLFSRGIGDEVLLRDFNGKSYIIEGREFPIPKLIWQKVLQERFNRNFIYRQYGGTYKYVSLKWTETTKYLGDLSEYARVGLFNLNVNRRRFFQKMRARDKLFKAYCSYWKIKAENLEETRPNEFQRILALDNKKYFAYKQKALSAFDWNKHHANMLDIPRKGICVPRFAVVPPCHTTANDTYLSYTDRNGKSKKIKSLPTTEIQWQFIEKTIFNLKK